MLERERERERERNRIGNSIETREKLGTWKSTNATGAPYVLCIFNFRASDRSNEVTENYTP